MSTFTDQQILEGWNDSKGQGNEHARTKDDGCAIIKTNSFEIALMLTRIGLEECFVIPSAYFWDGDYLSFSAIQSGSAWKETKKMMLQLWYLTMMEYWLKKLKDLR